MSLRIVEKSDRALLAENYFIKVFKAPSRKCPKSVHHGGYSDQSRLPGTGWPHCEMKTDTLRKYEVKL
jgi:hypothetical protein